MMRIMVQAWDRVDNDRHPLLRPHRSRWLLCAGMDIRQPETAGRLSRTAATTRHASMLKGRLGQPLIAAVEGTIASGTEILQRLKHPGRQ